MRNPYLLDRPAVVSFSGGRTSGYLLWQVLQAFGGTLPEDVAVVFCNTGKERPETLDFVNECAGTWGVAVRWLEYRRKAQHKFVEVDYATASRQGEPFEQLIAAKALLPNVVMRYCTQWLKIKASNRFVRHVLGWADYTNAVGLRADEPWRVAKLRPDKKSCPGEDPIAPLHRAGATLADVTAFWKAQPFDLRLRPHEGNCDLCFLKGQGKLVEIMRDRPDLAAWWVEQEQRFQGKTRLEEAGRFRKNAPSYAATLKMAQEQKVFDWPDDGMCDCRCTD